jgi:hypothetical protein
VRVGALFALRCTRRDKFPVDVHAGGISFATDPESFNQGARSAYKHANMRARLYYLVNIRIRLWSARSRVNQQADARTEQGKTNYGRAETQVVAAAAALSFNGAISVPAGVAAAADASRRPPARQEVIALLSQLKY